MAERIMPLHAIGRQAERRSNGNRRRGRAEGGGLAAATSEAVVAYL